MDWSERIIPDETPKGILSVHLKRYALARPNCHGKQILDLGCGVGYGSSYLAQVASKVIAIDADWEAVKYARRRYRLENIEYLVADAGKIPSMQRSFDIICSFEVIEHVQDFHGFLAEVARALKEAGLFFVSTPCTRQSGNKIQNPHHHQEWSPTDFRNLLEQYFSSVEMLWQVRKQTQTHYYLQKLDAFNLRSRWLPIPIARALARMTHTIPFADLDLEDMEIQPDFSENALCQIGVCKEPK